ncbi:hypothetical protein [Bacteroides muris (ex Fokt et al. 2023)]|uniref:beta-galactosidase n=1 Tax=Bacteroides muris (ex Fokt et al. 2023) TaxID=2937417 RepID=A0A9X2SSY7_9BACE|nr:hypothetical protein [Bacteroides muris (ex Fokt et al. 2023)]MCR6504122.1 hypothetical protein [Bacteroides muris (ex Fokt et al. 2023)]
MLQYPGVYACKGDVEVNCYFWYPSEGDKVAFVRKEVEIRSSVENQIILNLLIEQPRLWQAGEPNQYKVEVVLRNKKGEAIDDYVLTIGIRIIEQKNGTLYVNNRAEMLLHNRDDLINFVTVLGSCRNFHVKSGQTFL